MLRTSGPVSSASWRTVTRGSGHATRIDLQTSILYECDASSIARSALPEFRPHHQSRCRQRKCSKTSASDGSFIGTVGSRQSERYLRVYDKGREQRSHPPGRLWRIEGEFKARAATTVLSLLAASESVQSCCSSVLSSLVTSRGGQWPLCTATPVRPEGMYAGRSRAAIDPIEWIRTQVVPSLQRIASSERRDILYAMLANELGWQFTEGPRRTTRATVHLGDQ